MKQQLDNLNTAIETYSNRKAIPGAMLLRINKNINITLCRLAVIRDEYHTKYEKVIFDSISKGDSAAKGTNKAKIEVPELYLLRKVILAAEGISKQISQEVSWLKSEMNNLKQ